eukprot:1149624-Pelagomonas_calceolata.AAC.2
MRLRLTKNGLPVPKADGAGNNSPGSARGPCPAVLPEAPILLVLPARACILSPLQRVRIPSSCKACVGANLADYLWQWHTYLLPGLDTSLCSPLACESSCPFPHLVQPTFTSLTSYTPHTRAMATSRQRLLKVRIQSFILARTTLCRKLFKNQGAMLNAMRLHRPGVQGGHQAEAAGHWNYAHP